VFYLVYEKINSSLISCHNRLEKVVEFVIYTSQNIWNIQRLFTIPCHLRQQVEEISYTVYRYPQPQITSKHINKNKNSMVTLIVTRLKKCYIS